MAVHLNKSNHDRDRSKQISLSDKHTCYVLITCTDPSEDGKIEVEMTYEGDPVLAAYLVESAQGRFSLET